MRNTTRVVVHTGNILEKEELIRNVGLSTLEELRASVKSSLNVWTRDEIKLPNGLVEIRGHKDREKAAAIKSYLTTVKIFLASNDGRCVKDAVDTVKKEMKIDAIHSVIVIPPDVSDDLSLNGLKSIWHALESCVDKGIVTGIGIADLAPQLFEQLYIWARVKPSTIQLSLSSCCAIPEDLKAFAKANDVQILIHSDDAEVIDEDLVATILSRVGMAGSQCQVEWLARHRSIQPSYGLVQDKGYTLALSVDH